ncbi:NAD(P)-binding protein [Irpex rosettiformis]|uniref:NAD(P)-binding protein n=1 Tax=Irpex rosettiformis TaxID=378272 RepID=A0ACB8TRS4_9APHY|nr:NAD(P)-binding protein [Irpex rosettiformis]
MATSFSLDSIFDLKDRIAVVTGGGTGIGWMIAQGLATNGAKVYITGRRRDVLEKSIASFERKDGFGEIFPIQMDVTSRESISAVKQELQAKEGKLHILINNAGQVGPVSRFFNNLSSPEHESPEKLGDALFNNESFEQWAQLYTINSSSIFFVTTALLGLLAKGSEDNKQYPSSVVNISSISGYMKLAQNHFAYNSSKAAVSHLTKMMATEFVLKKIPVRVSGIAPGVYESELTAERLSKGPNSTNIVGQGIQPVPADRPGTAQEMVGAVIFLVSPAGGYTNGQEIIVDGSYLAVNPSRI